MHYTCALYDMLRGTIVAAWKVLVKCWSWSWKKYWEKSLGPGIGLEKSLVYITEPYSLCWTSAASWVTKLGARSCNVPTDRCKFSTEEIKGAQKFNFAPKCPLPKNNSQKWGIFRTKFCIFEGILSTRIKFPDGLKFRGRAIAPPCHNASAEHERGRDLNCNVLHLSVSR